MKSFRLSMLPHIAGECEITVTSQSRIALRKILEIR